MDTVDPREAVVSRGRVGTPDPSVVRSFSSQPLPQIPVQLPSRAVCSWTFRRESPDLARYGRIPDPAAAQFRGRSRHRAQRRSRPRALSMSNVISTGGVAISSGPASYRRAVLEDAVAASELICRAPARGRRVRRVERGEDTRARRARRKARRFGLPGGRAPVDQAKQRREGRFRRWARDVGRSPERTGRSPPRASVGRLVFVGAV